VLEKRRGELQSRSPREIRAMAVDLFRESLAAGKVQAAHRPREARLTWPDELIRQSEVQLAVAAVKIVHSSDSSATTPSQKSLVVVEGMLASPDGFLRGKPDRIESVGYGTVIVDYKTGSLTDPERLAEYREQCLFYAWLWHATHREWPIEMRIVNPIPSEEHIEAIDVQEVIDHVADARARLTQVASMSIAESACIGKHCAYCSFRPWCEPWWAAEDKIAKSDLSDEPQSFEAVVRLIECWDEPTGRKGHAHMETSGGALTIQFSRDEFPHLAMAIPGDVLRILDARLVPGRASSWYLTTWSEVYTVVP